MRTIFEGAFWDLKIWDIFNSYNPLYICEVALRESSVWFRNHTKWNTFGRRWYSEEKKKKETGNETYYIYKVWTHNMVRFCNWSEFNWHGDHQDVFTQTTNSWSMIVTQNIWYMYQNKVCLLCPLSVIDHSMNGELHYVGITCI